MTDPAAELLAEAEEQIEAWLCELDAAWARLLDDAHEQAADIVAAAEEHAAAILADAEAEAVRVRALALESTATAETLALAADAAATGRVKVDDLASLGHAVHRLRTELSRVVEAAFDAIPAVEATAAALAVVDAPVDAPAPRRRGFVRRLFSRA